MGEEYRGLFGAFRFAFTASSSIVFRSYVVVSGVVGVYTAVLLGLGIVVWFSNPIAFGERGLLALVGILILIPLFGPVLIVARRYRHGTGRDQYDGLIGAAGYGFILSLGLALAISDPEGHGDGSIAALIDTVPAQFALVPPVIAVGVLVSVIWVTRRIDTPEN